MPSWGAPGTLQLAIKTGLVLPDVVKAIDAARKVVSHFRHSAVATCFLKKWQEQPGIRANKLQADCLVRWNSTVVMLQITVQSLLADETVTRPSVQKSLALRASQWEPLEQLIPVMQPLAKATEIMCGELHMGLSFIYPFILESKREAAQSHFNSLLQDEGELLVATAEEVHDYLLTPHIPTMENPLQWWACNEDRLPRLAKLYKSNLAVPATSNPSKRIFSSGWEYHHMTAGKPSTSPRGMLERMHVTGELWESDGHDEPEPNPGAHGTRLERESGPTQDGMPSQSLASPSPLMEVGGSPATHNS
ncbi:hypothetical protein Z043_124142 [Scleropages formosus]|uniref:HAT C-terminal dimerisation domain-containing protein n=1 Tax=Scleropages formosus TaxID=113540 RepID=A0A0P7WAR4_SCLFO|nr:hypothetical protein Z043_124142 [Scleropages formosus]